MKATNIYTSFLIKVWNLIKKVSMTIVAGIPTHKIYSENTTESRIYERDEETTTGSEKHYHRSRAKPAVEKQTLLKETKKQKKF
jgi:hypothetical protein